MVVWPPYIQVEIQVSKIYCINRATSMLPFSIEDAARSEAEQVRIVMSYRNYTNVITMFSSNCTEVQGRLTEYLFCYAWLKAVHVGQDTCLNARALHLRLLFNQAGFRIKTQVKNVSVRYYSLFLSTVDFLSSIYVVNSSRNSLTECAVPSHILTFACSRLAS